MGAVLDLRRLLVSEVLELLQRVLRKEGVSTPLRGVTPEQLARLDSVLGFPAPPALRDWLAHCNGAPVAGYLMGIKSSYHAPDIERHVKVYPEWKPRRWVPVAGDGCGNYYVLDASRCYLDHDAVFFIDTHVDEHRLTYVVASDL